MQNSQLQCFKRVYLRYVVVLHSQHIHCIHLINHEESVVLFWWFVHNTWNKRKNILYIMLSQWLPISHVMTANDLASAFSIEDLLQCVHSPSALCWFPYSSCLNIQMGTDGPIFAGACVSSVLPSEVKHPFQKLVLSFTHNAIIYNSFCFKMFCWRIIHVSDGKSNLSIQI